MNLQRETPAENTQTRVLESARPETVRAAAELLAAGQVVALPTETVYGLGADATRPEALARVFEAKERPYFDPLIVHLPDRSWLDRVAAEVPLLAQKLINAFWPGPLTVVLPKQPVIPDLATSGLPSVAVRMSANRVFQAVASAFGRPIAAPSANRFGRISPTTAQHVLSELDGRIPLIVDGGPTDHGLESTIVAVESDAIRILRNGPITREELVKFGPVVSGPAMESAAAPGQLLSHYAPRTPMRLVDSVLDFNPVPGQRWALLAWEGEAPAEPAPAAVEILSPSGDLREAASRLFAAMRRLDEAGVDLIVAERVPETGLGRAIMDRLSKASYVGD